MAPADSLILLQYLPGSDVFFFLAIWIILGVIVFVCVLLVQLEREQHEGTRERPSYYRARTGEVTRVPVREVEEASASALPSFVRSPGSTDWRVTDTPSSPVGGSCLVCGAKVTDETSTFCGQCGAERQRCPICQRYVAGGQLLLACIHCRTPGHANEMLVWVEQHGTCPYCARRIDKSELKPIEDQRTARRRKR